MRRWQGKSRAPLLALAAAALLAILLAMIDFQSQLIFPTHAVPAPGPLPSGAVRVSLRSGDGQTLHGVHIPPSRAASGPTTLILSFAGNAWNSEDAADYLHQLYGHAHIVGFHYRGYRPSTGTPSADALIADAPRTHDFAVERVKPERVVAVGFSIGSGVASALARKRALDGLILVTPFDSLKAVASDHYPMLPVGLFFQHEMNSASALKKVDVPVAIVAAERDSLIPKKRTDALRRQVRNLVFDRTIRGGNHNDIYARGDFHAAMRQALASLEL
jgi:pimeloyl-ACP methyl ester carboxylesterase